MRLSTYARIVVLLVLGVPVGCAASFLVPTEYRSLLLGLGFFAYFAVIVFLLIMAVVLGRVRCPLCGLRGELGHSPNKGKRYTLFWCPQCGWIDSKGIIRMRFSRLGNPGEK